MGARGSTADAAVNGATVRPPWAPHLCWRPLRRSGPRSMALRVSEVSQPPNPSVRVAVGEQLPQRRASGFAVVLLALLGRR
jgi:hypothetical protein